MKARPGKFGVRADIGGGAAICLYEQPLRSYGDNYWIPDPVYKFFITWPGAYFGAFWRNLLGSLYVPFSPTQRWKLEYSRTPREPRT